MGEWELVSAPAPSGILGRQLALPAVDCRDATAEVEAATVTRGPRREGHTGPGVQRILIHFWRLSAQQQMALSVSQKGKGRLYPADSLDRAEYSSGSSTSSFSSSSESESESASESGTDSSEDDDEDEVSQEYLDSLLEKARANIAEKAANNTPPQNGDALEDVIKLDDPESELECVFWPHPSLSACSHPFQRTPPT